MQPEPKHLLFTADKELNAQTHIHCAECGAPVGEPCLNPTDKVHIRRVDDYVHWLITYNARYRPAGHPLLESLRLKRINAA